MHVFCSPVTRHHPSPHPTSPSWTHIPTFSYGHPPSPILLPLLTYFAPHHHHHLSFLLTPYILTPSLLNPLHFHPISCHPIPFSPHTSPPLLTSPHMFAPHPNTLFIPPPSHTPAPLLYTITPHHLIPQPPSHPHTPGSTRLQIHITWALRKNRSTYFRSLPSTGPTTS